MIIALIPARKGSKGVKNKNLLKINDISIVNHAIKIGLSIKSIEHTILSSDSSKILNQAKFNNQKVIKIKRSQNISKDSTPILPVMEDAIKFIEKKTNKKVSFLVILDPTSPLREKKDIIKAIKIFKKKKLDLLVSVNEAEHNPYFSILEKDKKYYSLSKGKNSNIGSRQKAKQVFNINTIVWIYSKKAIMQIKKRIPFKTNIIIMPNKRSQEINTKADWTKVQEYFNK